MTHWRKLRCEGRQHVDFYCTYPDCDCYFSPEGDLRDDNRDVPVHSDVLGERSRHGIQGGDGNNVVPMSRGRRSADGDPALHGSREAGDLRLREEADEPLDTDRHGRVDREVDPWKLAAIVFVLVFWGLMTYVVLRLTGVL